MHTLQPLALGSQGLHVPVEGLGCMGMTSLHGMSVYEPADEAENIATIHRARELGVHWLDTADLYGPFLNEQLVARAVAGQRHAYTLATKFGFVLEGEGAARFAVNGHPDYAAHAVERSLQNLNTDYIDLYYLHAPDPNVPIEESVGAMSRLVEQGKVRYLGVSNVAAEQLRRAHAVHPLTAVQNEYSLFDRRAETEGVLATARELGIGFVAYSPLGRGFLTGQVQQPEDVAGDIRAYLPRYQGDNFAKNLQLVQAVEALATAKQVTTAQLALAWVLAQGAFVIPGTKRRRYLELNVQAASLTLSPEELATLDATVPAGSVAQTQG